MFGGPVLGKYTIAPTPKNPPKSLFVCTQKETKGKKCDVGVSLGPFNCRARAGVSNRSAIALGLPVYMLSTWLQPCAHKSCVRNLLGARCVWFVVCDLVAVFCGFVV